MQSRIVRKGLVLGIIVLLLGTGFTTGLYVNNKTKIFLNSSLDRDNKTILSIHAEEWNKTYGGVGEDWCYDGQQTKDGGYILVGYTTSQGSGQEDIWLVKTDMNGTMVWNKTFGGYTQDKGYSVQQTTDGGYILTGKTFSYGHGSCDLWLIKTDENGNEQWNKTHGNVQADAGFSVKQTSEGRYIITGYTRSYGWGDPGDIWLIKTNETGVELWNRTWGGPYTGASEEGFSVEQTPDSGYILTGCYYDDSVYGYDVILIKTDENGNEEWNRTWGGKDNDIGNCVKVTLDGGYIISGRIQKGLNMVDAWLIKTDAIGIEQWNKSYGGAYSDSAESVFQTDSGGYILTGYTYIKYNNSLKRDLLLIETDSDGNEIWNNTFGTIYKGEAGYSVQQTTDEGYAILGYTYSYGAGLSDFWLIKTSLEFPPSKVYVDDDYNESTPGWGYDHFDKIQDGIDAVNESGTVYVYNGLYYENVIIHKDGIQLLGEVYSTIIDANNSGDGILVPIASNYITISDFTVRNANGSGIIFHDPVSGRNCKYNTISRCIVYNSSYNNDWKSGVGIILGGHDAYMEGNKIISCITYDNDKNGIRIIRSAYDQIIDNKIVNCHVFNNGFQGYEGVMSKAGILIHNHYNRYIQNTIISKCEIHHNAGDGMYIGNYASGTQIFENTISYNNLVGINISGTVHNDSIYNNNLYFNEQEAKDVGSNTWYNSTSQQGNFWVDYTGEDSDGDGIGDTPYDVPGGSNQDLYPLIYLFGPPYANFVYDNETSVFDASLSGDYNGEIVSYSWDFGDGTGEGKVVYHKYCEVGTYRVGLEVWDNEGRKGSYHKTVDVLIANIPPTLDIYGPNHGKPGVTYDYVFINTDPDKDDLMFYIKWGDNSISPWIGPLAYGESIIASHDWSEVGTYVINTTLKDFCGEWDGSTLEVNIPRARPTYNPLLIQLFERFPNAFPILRQLLGF
ncbi:MAG: PKD domain-containing protein [Thermoplasmatales archaeon]|nr:MAG: PKD domain-containing protein [Thermoplasmatales archaeon]